MSGKPELLELGDSDSHVTLFAIVIESEEVPLGIGHFVDNVVVSRWWWWGVEMTL